MGEADVEPLQHRGRGGSKKAFTSAYKASRKAAHVSWILKGK